jgi:hypothetical protein
LLLPHQQLAQRPRLLPGLLQMQPAQLLVQLTLPPAGLVAHHHHEQQRQQY